MEDEMKPLNDALLRNGMYYVHIRIPKELRPDFEDKRFITESVRTKNRSEARALVHKRANEVRDDFKKRLAAKQRTQEPKPAPSPQSFADLGRQYGREIAERELTSRANLYEAVTANADATAAFWRGEVVPLPTYPDHGHGPVDGFRYFDKLVADGDLDSVVGYIIRERAKTRISDLKRMIAIGSMGEMLALAVERSPGLGQTAILALALTLARAEIEALQSALAGDVDGPQQAQSPSPAFTTNIASAAPSLPPVSLDVLFDKWKAETKPSASTISTWRGIVKALKAALPGKVDDAGSITPEDIIGWKDDLVAAGKAEATVNRSHLGCVRRIFGYGVKNKLLFTNPGVGVEMSRNKKAGTGRLPYSNDEAARLLMLAKQESRPDRRWLPWLAAATGSRIGEVAQLQGSYVRCEGGIHYLDIKPAPDAGSIKEEVSERPVPIHPQLIRDGFLQFVAKRGDGPLFYNKSSGDPEKKHASKGVTNRLGQWIRENGFTNPRQAPNHAFRHWFKTEASRVGIEDRLIDKIQGHATGTDSSKYYHPDLRAKLAALEKIVLPPPS